MKLYYIKYLEFGQEKEVRYDANNLLQAIGDFEADENGLNQITEIRVF